MDSYLPMYNYYASSPTMPCAYSDYATPMQSFCSCCCAPPSYYSYSMSPTFVSSPSTPSSLPQLIQASTPSMPKQSAKRQQVSNKSARLQYSYRDRFILNELFKRTPYPNAIQRDVIARRLSISSEQIRIWFQNRRRLQTQRDAGEKLETINDIDILQKGRTSVDSNDLRDLLNEVTKYKNAPPRLRLDNSL